MQHVAITRGVAERSLVVYLCQLTLRSHGSESMVGCPCTGLPDRSEHVAGPDAHAGTSLGCHDYPSLFSFCPLFLLFFSHLLQL